MVTLIGVIQSEANQYCQDEWIKNLQRLKGEYEVLIVENSFDDSNFEYLKSKFQHVLKGPYINVVKDRIVENRNIILDWFRQHKEYDDLLLIDSDIFPPSNVLSVLQNTKKNICGAVCWIVGNATSLRAAWNFFPDDVKNGKHLKWLEHLEGNMAKVYDRGELIKVKEIGLGCVLFNGEMLRNEKDISFRSTEFELHEDFDFIRDFRSRNYDCYLNTKVSCFHDLRKFMVEVN